MPLVDWPQPPIRIIQKYEARRAGRGEISALILWATWSVEGLHYLDDLDALHRDCLPIASHSPDIINIAHVRWATSSAITSLDLCAAALARECCGWSGSRELDLRDFDPSAPKKEILSRRKALPTAALVWVDVVLADQRYKDVQGARNPLTHSRLRRNLYSSGPKHTEFVVAATGTALRARDLVCHARDLATERVASFLDVVETLP
jgi:hypothetical protein